jgi:peptide/nickel transport system substrate-binding protein
VRRALGLALDKQRLVDTVTFGTAIAATEDIPSFMWAFDPTAGTTKHDLPAAAALLDAAGWRAGADGMRSRNGVKLTIGLASRTDSVTDRERSVIIGAMLHDAGIEVTQHAYTTAVLYGPAAAHGVLASGNYDAGLLTWYAGVDPDDSSQLLCSQRPPNGYDWSRYCTPQMDAAQAIALSKYDRASRGKAYKQIEQLLAADMPYVYLWWPRQVEAVNDDLKNFKPNGIVESWNSWEWTI